MTIRTNSARDRMIQSATSLFHKHGIRGTSVDQILKDSRTGKSQFSHYFKNKDGLVRAVIEQLHEIIRSDKAPTGYTLKSWKDMEQWFDRYIQFQISTGCQLSCPLGTIGGDLSKEQELLRQDVKIFFQWCTNQLARFFAEKKAAGELIKSANPDELADFCVSLMEGGMLMAKIKRDTRIFKNASNQALNYINLLRIKQNS